MHIEQTLEYDEDYTMHTINTKEYQNHPRTRRLDYSIPLLQELVAQILRSCMNEK